MRQLPGPSAAAGLATRSWSAVAGLAAWSWSLVAGRHLVAERGRWRGGMRQLRQLSNVWGVAAGESRQPVARCVGHDGRRAEAAVPRAV
jgi:hypothetical protein